MAQEKTGKLAQIAKISGLSQSRLTRIKEGETKNPLFMTNIRILAAIFQVFPDINIEKILFTLSSVFISMLTERRSSGMHEGGPGKSWPKTTRLAARLCLSR
jgi:transcriptional regulator with XRE-family HTH domain